MRTYDNLPVDAEDFKLRWVLVDFYGFNKEQPLLDFYVEHNVDSAGNKKRYWVLCVFRLHFSGGWLFEKRG